MNTTVDIKNFLTFGPGVGDLILTRADDTLFGPFSISQSIPYLDSFYLSYYISINGYIGFRSNIRHIYPYNIDINTRTGGNIFYRQINSLDLNNVKSEINKMNSTFSPTSGFVVTWYQVPRYGGSSTGFYTFQSIVISNGNQTYLVYNYDDQALPIQWGSSSTGFENGNGINLFNGNSSIIMGNSSNVNVTGRWIFQVDSININPTPSITTTTTTPSIPTTTTKRPTTSTARPTTTTKRPTTTTKRQTTTTKRPTTTTT
jgi:hypothetical protein